MTNKNLIAINQDKLSKQAKRIKTGLYDILAKPLENGKVAIMVYNKGLISAKIKININSLIKYSYINLSEAGNYTLTDVYTNESRQIKDTFQTEKLKIYQSAVYILEAKGN